MKIKQLPDQDGIVMGEDCPFYTVDSTQRYLKAKVAVAKKQKALVMEYAKDHSDMSNVKPLIHQYNAKVPEWKKEFALINGSSDYDLIGEVDPSDKADVEDLKESVVKPAIKM